MSDQQAMRLTCQELKVILIGIFVAVATCFGIDMHLPALPTLMKVFHASTSEMQNSVTVYMLSIVVTSFFYGPLSDKYGRKIPMAIGMIICALGSAICFFSHTLDWFLVGRFVQGIGAGAGLSITRSLLSDVLTKEKLSAYGSYMSIFVTLGIMVSPMIGGYALTYISWQSIFFVLGTFFLLAALLVVFILPETVHTKNPNALHPVHLIKNYWTIAKNPVFLSFTLISGMAYSMVMAYVTVSPFLFQIQYHLSPVIYGWLGLITGLFGMLGKGLSGYQVSKTQRITTGLLTGLSCTLLVGLISSVCAYLSLNNAIAVVVWVCLINLFSGFIFANAMGGALSEFRHMGGSASALYGSLQWSCGLLTAAFITVIPTHGDKVLSTAYLVLPAIGLASFFVGRHFYRKNR